MFQTLYFHKRKPTPIRPVGQMQPQSAGPRKTRVEYKPRHGAKPVTFFFAKRVRPVCRSVMHLCLYEKG